MNNKKAIPSKEIVDIIVSDYAKRIRQAREKLGLTQKDFAMKISEKESVLHKLETGAIEPSIETAKKLEKTLKIKLVEQREEENEVVQAGKKEAEGFTIGDMLKKKI